jgi:hypothetical protein
MYISITGLKPKGLWGLIKFWTLAVPTFREAQIAKGNRHCVVKQIHGYQCTITAWDNRDLMLNFMRNGTHLTAMKSFHKIATGKTYGFESDKIPSWGEAFELLKTKGITY